jgi:hypothetical protein
MQTKAAVDSPSTEVIPQKHATVSALDAAGNNTVETLQSDKFTRVCWLFVNQFVFACCTMQT